jgi:hypothetical protein
MNTPDFGEPVIVGAIFGSGANVRPSWFLFGGRKVKVEKTHYTWTERQGRAILHHFSVTGGADTFHLVFSSEDLSWRLEIRSLSK